VASKLDFTQFKTIFHTKYGTQYSDDFIAENFNLYISLDLDDTLDWVFLITIGD
jgi:hypothetical protein